ncbi:MAG: hypothetical protein JSR44_07495 [Spirochaetes bacterium]|nr:hypothetical protein [Spirochaetota bacterium]
MRTAICLWLLTSSCTVIFAKYTIEMPEDSVTMGSYLESHEDKGGTLTIEEIRRDNMVWTAVAKPNPNFGYSSSAIWLRLIIHNNTHSEISRAFEIGYPLLDHIEFYEPTGTTFTKTITGDIYPFENRKIDSTYFVFPVRFAPHAESVFFFRIKSSSPLLIPLKLWDAKALLEKDRHEMVAIWLYYGLVFGIFLYNLFIYFMTKEKLHLLYCVCVFAFGFLSFAINGYGSQYIWADSPFLKQESPIVSLSLTISSQVFFLYAYLYDRARKHWTWYLTIVLAALAPIVLFLRVFVSYRTTINSLMIVSIFVMLFMIFGSIQEAMKRKKIAYFYLAGFGLFVLGNLLIALRNMGLLPSHVLIHWSGQIGSAAEMLIFSLGIGYRYSLIKVEKERAEIRNLQEKVLMLESISRFVPKQFIKILEKEDVSYLNLGDSREVRMSVLFADIRNFTALAESMNSADTFRFINSYLKRMGPIIQKEHGFIDKFIGDAIMALFSEPVNNAVDAAIAMRSELEIFNEHRRSSGYATIEIGIGINTGSIMLGTVGSTGRLDTTVIGDAVNLSSRIESLTKRYGAHILITDSVHRLLENIDKYDLREIDSVVVKGKTQPVVVYEIFNNDADTLKAQKTAILSDFALGLAFYKSADFKQAIERFDRCIQICPNDKPSQLYFDRCKKLAAESPKAGWQGVTILK